MPDKGPLPIDIEPLGDAIVVRPHGNVDLSSSPDLRDALQEVISRNAQRTVVDLANVGYMDSSGVATLVAGLQAVRHGEGVLVLCGMNDRVQSIFQIARLDTIFTIVDTLDDAVGGDG
jgi:anti-sigma B factor antagonist